MSTDAEIDKLVHREYAAGFTTSVESETLPPGLDESVIRHISARKGEPEWLLEWRLAAYQKWLQMTPPQWAHIHHPPIDFDQVSYFSAPKSMADRPQSLDEVDPELLRTYEKLGIPLHEQATLAGVAVAVDAVFDSVSIGTTFRGKLLEAGVIFCSISEAVHEYPELIKEYLGSVVPQGDNFYAALNSAVFSDGSFVYIPKGVKCPMELSTYFRINEAKTGQFERTLIVADEGSQVSYLEGCTAPMRDENQLHAAVVELVARKDAKIKYSTVQNWYPGDEQGRGGIYNFVTKRGCPRKRAYFLDSGGNRLSDYLEISERDSARRQLSRRILLGGPDSRAPAGRYRHQDDSSGQKHQKHHHFQGHFSRPQPEYLSWSGADQPAGRRARATSPSAIRC
jgi:Fe-S cluster assembly protein SufB